METSLRIEAVASLRIFFVRSNEFYGAMLDRCYISDVHAEDLYKNMDDRRGCDGLPNREQLLQLQMNFRSMLRGMRTQWDRHLERQSLNVNMTQFAVLDLLFRNGSMKVTDVAKELRLTPGAVTGITDKLTQMEYVTRNRDALDRRINYLELTEAGQEKVKAVEIQREFVFARFFEGIPDEELLYFLRICQQVNLNLDEISEVGE